jgi:hypothetical protein
MDAGSRVMQEQLPRGGNKIILYLFIISKEINFNSPHPTLPSMGGLGEKAVYPLNLAETHG